MMDALELFNEICMMQETENETKNANVSDGLSERFGRNVAVSIMANI